MYQGVFHPISLTQRCFQASLFFKAEKHLSAPIELCLCVCVTGKKMMVPNMITQKKTQLVTLCSCIAALRWSKNHGQNFVKNVKNYRMKSGLRGCHYILLVSNLPLTTLGARTELPNCNQRTIEAKWVVVSTTDPKKKLLSNCMISKLQNQSKSYSKTMLLVKTPWIF